MIIISSLALYFLLWIASLQAGVITGTCTLTRETETLQRFHSAQLVDKKGRPITVKQLDVGQSYIFHYPYVSTSCFLLNLNRPTKGGTPFD